jgi:L-lactate dehydrogenase (cytochrome)
MDINFDTRYPSISDLRSRARKRIPPFAFDYLDGGCNDDVNLRLNRSSIEKIQLMPRYILDYKNPDTSGELFGRLYDAPFGIAPVGLQGMIWPNAAEILARAAFRHNIPFILSTVSTSSIERIAEITEGQAWFQFYHPAENSLRDKILKRASDHCPVLVILADVPAFGFRPRDIRNGLSLPPKMSFKNILQMLSHPNWALRTVYHGVPTFETLKPYTPKNINLKQLGGFMNKTFAGRLSETRISAIRDKWKGKLVIKGIVSEEDTEKAIQLGLDGIIVSNHGGRQLDSGESSIVPMIRLVTKYKGKLKIMVDSGVRSGVDVARVLACGADFAFMGRSFMYGVAALGDQGGHHTISLLKAELLQVMEQIGCSSMEDLSNHLIDRRLVE